MANAKGNPAFGKAYTGATPRKPKPVAADPPLSRAAVVRAADEKIAQHLDELVDDLLSIAHKNKNQTVIMYLLDRVLGPTNKVAVERDDQLFTSLEQLARAIREGAGPNSELASSAGVLRDGGLPAERQPDPHPAGDGPSE